MREGEGPPLFLVHGLSGTVMECWALVKALRTGRPVWGLQAPGIDGDAPPLRLVEQMASTYVANIRSVQRVGPYALCGFSFGGLVAYEMAVQLAEAGETVDPLVLLDPYVHRAMGSAHRLAERAYRAGRRLLRMPAPVAWAWLRGRLHGPWLAGTPPWPPSAGLGMPPAQARVYDALSDAIGQYRPKACAAPVLFVHAHEVLRGQVNPVPAWRALLGDRLQVVDLPGEHLDLVGRHAARVASLLDEGLGAARG